MAAPRRTRRCTTSRSWYLHTQSFRLLFSPVHRLHSPLPPVKSNPHGLRSSDHNFQLPVCDNFRHKSFITRSLFFDLKRFLLSSLYVFLIASLYFSYACSIVYYTFCTTAIPTALNSAACTFAACYFNKCSILQYGTWPVRRAGS